MRFKDMDEERKKVDELTKAHQNLRLEGENYLIRPFQNMAEIEREGELLHHAIAYYAIDRYTKGNRYCGLSYRTSNTDGLKMRSRRISTKCWQHIYCIWTREHQTDGRYHHGEKGFQSCLVFKGRQ